MMTRLTLFLLSAIMIVLIFGSTVTMAVAALPKIELKIANIDVKELQAQSRDNICVVELKVSVKNTGEVPLAPLVVVEVFLDAEKQPDIRVHKTFKSPIAAGNTEDMTFLIDPHKGTNTIKVSLIQTSAGFLHDSAEKKFECNPKKMQKGQLDVNPGLIGPGQNVVIRLCAEDEPIHVLDTRITTPLGASFFDVFADFTIDPNACNIWNVSDFTGLSTGEIGNYLIEVDTDADTFFGEFATTFLVLPESPIGAVAIIGSSLGALGAFVGMRRHGAKF